MGSRRKGRILAFQALYSWNVHHKEGEKPAINDDLLEFSWAKTENGKGPPLKEDVLTFSRLLVTGTIENIKKIDNSIKKHLENWDIKRLNKVDLAVLRISAYALIFQPEMHTSIIIDEAVEISKDYGTGDSWRFVNGVLDAMAKTVRAK